MAFEHVAEPYRTSLLDVLKKNLKTAKRTTYLHRLIYIANHTFQNFAAANEAFQKVITPLVEGYSDENISGMLLYYPDYFCHVLESSEITMRRLLFDIFKSEEMLQNVGRMKVLAVYHHINQRLLEEWTCYSDKPPTLLEKIDPDLDRESTTKYIYNCINKLYKLMIKHRPSSDDGEISFEDQSAKHVSMSFASPVRMKFTDFLPEYSLLDFLLKTKHTEDLEDYLFRHSDLPRLETYNNMVWPAPPSYVPFNVFDTFQEPIVDLPPRESIRLIEIKPPERVKKEN